MAQIKTTKDETDQNQREEAEDQIQEHHQHTRNPRDDDQYKQKLESDLKQKSQDLKTLTGDHERRLDYFQTTAYQLANYYFVFQGVILAALSNTSHLTCHNRWFLFTLSLLAALLNLCMWFTTGVSYIRTMAERDYVWMERNEIETKLRALHYQMKTETTNFSSGSDSQDRPWRDRYTEKKRWFYLGVCVVVFLGFASVTLTGCWRILCQHDGQECNRHHGNENCIKLCDG
ncbi:ATP-dependent RNA helicase ddx56 [Actinidia chinensis var. chinensis]|uniref:ATP-dependent RNA helicase ddx56 n=1 Tax=Actinidia chinensis var. chinensis TaxID=1590841 RepID=A0A2R6Q2R2_ACTCC|nr:ATP-dependent RNA helicase ddx56 [Actinidia chinensis var. chinensis]